MRAPVALYASGATLLAVAARASSSAESALIRAAVGSDDVVFVGAARRGLIPIVYVVSPESTVAYLPHHPAAEPLVCALGYARKEAAA